jgi:hypothetical protein
MSLLGGYLENPTGKVERFQEGVEQEKLQLGGVQSDQTNPCIMMLIERQERGGMRKER